MIEQEDTGKKCSAAAHHPGDLTLPAELEDRDAAKCAEAAWHPGDMVLPLDCSPPDSSPPLLHWGLDHEPLQNTQQRCVARPKLQIYPMNLQEMTDFGPKDPSSIKVIGLHTCSPHSEVAAPRGRNVGRRLGCFVMGFCSAC